MAEAGSLENPQASLTQAKALKFWFPLALSWVCMAAEAPICLSIISRSANAEVNTAAMQPLMAIAIFIEAPVIDLLSTATTLGRTLKQRQALTRFAWMMMVWVTLIHALVVWTPLYDVVAYNLMHLERAVGEAAHWPLRVLSLWSAFIGWRRFRQGLMIRSGETKAISYGTLLRVSTVALVGYSLHFLTRMDGLFCASIGLMSSVVVETLFIHVISNKVLEDTHHPEQEGDEELNWRALFKFHLPLTGATMVTLIGGPILTAALSQSEDPVSNLAAFQLGSSLVWLFRTATFALPEVVIALATNRETRQTMASFSLRVGLFLALALLACFLTGADAFWFRTVLGAEENLIPLARTVVLLSCLIPIVGAAMSFLRGSLTSARNTWGRLGAIIAGVLVLAVSLRFGLLFQLPGIWNACIAALLAQTAELAVLAYSWSKTTVADAPVAQEAG